jgi:hypothetical protein
MQKGLSRESRLKQTSEAVKNAMRWLLENRLLGMLQVARLAVFCVMAT